MSFFVGILTFVLVLICLFLILLVLVQLPKKDAGAGMAFGAGTADALFGAGSGNALTKITKYTAGAFLVLSLILSYLQSSLHPQNNGTDFTKMVEQKQQERPVMAPATQPKPQQTAPPQNLLMSAPTTSSNVPVEAPAPAPATKPTTNTAK